jgi:hypothetical protein
MKKAIREGLSLLFRFLRKLLPHLFMVHQAAVAEAEWNPFPVGSCIVDAAALYPLNTEVVLLSMK